MLAREVLRGETRGYQNHPQLDRFKLRKDPVAFIDTYLLAIFNEAAERGYQFDPTKIGTSFSRAKMSVTEGQLIYEFQWLRSKLIARDPDRLKAFTATHIPSPHPLFRVGKGGIELWERPI